MSKIAENKYAQKAVHPGTILNEILRDLAMSQSELAKRIGRPEQTISAIINGTKSVTPETAIQLQIATGIPAQTWNSLEKNYQEQIAYEFEQERLQKQSTLVNRYPYKEAYRRGWVKKADSLTEQTGALLRFFSINSFSALDQLSYVQFRKINGKHFSPEALSVWLRRGELEASKIKTKKFDENTVRESIPEIRKLSMNPPNFQKKLIELLAKGGVACTVVKPFNNTYVSGAAKWLTSDKALVQLSLRGKVSDKFWFNLFHELGHILLHKKKVRYIDFVKDLKNTPEELEADKFAANILIPPGKYEEFVRNGEFTGSSIKKFAADISIHPGIVVGRLQYDKHLEFNERYSLKTQYKFTS